MFGGKALAKQQFALEKTANPTMIYLFNDSLSSTSERKPNPQRPKGTMGEGMQEPNRPRQAQNGRGVGWAGVESTRCTSHEELETISNAKAERDKEQVVKVKLQS